VEDATNIWKVIIAAVGTAATYLWGGWDAVFAALVVLACMDYVTGWAAAWVHGRLSSDVGRRGIAKKVGMFVVVAVCNILDQLGGLGDPILRTVAIWGYISNEALSVVENLGEVGVPLPGRLRQALAVLRDRHDGEVGR
jgi:toxin secretion/phage lysis holin